MKIITKIVAYILGLFFLMSGIANQNIAMIAISIGYFIFSYFNMGCLKQNCSIDDSNS
ncbi:MAG: hypothetical protein RIF34_07830 [Candidatus Kapaibacterium sp.]